MQAMKGATMALGSMNRTMNLPSLQRIAMEFERENDIMEQRQEMMDDAIDDAMDMGLEEEGDEVVEQVLEEIGVDLSQAVRLFGCIRSKITLLTCSLPDGRDTIGTTGCGCPGEQSRPSSRWWGWWWWSRPRRRRLAGKVGQSETMNETLMNLGTIDWESCTKG